MALGSSVPTILESWSLPLSASKPASVEYALGSMRSSSSSVCPSRSFAIRISCRHRPIFAARVITSVAPLGMSGVAA